MNISLFQNNLKISFRNLIRGKAYSAINIIGLALGLAACLMLLNYTHYENHYDRTHPDLDRLYRVNQTAVWTPEGGIMGSTPPPLAEALKRDFPEIEATLRINTPGPRVVRFRQVNGVTHAYNESSVLAADSSFFSFFDFALMEGDPETALKGVGKVVISQETAQKFFGEERALGQILEFGDDRMPVEITGVTRSQATNQHFNFDYLLSMESNPNVKRFDWSWIWTQMVTYVKLKEGVDPDFLEPKFEILAEKYVQSSFDRMGTNYEDFVNGKGGWNFYLQAVKDIHLKSAEIGNRIGKLGNLETNRILRILAFLILLIAVVNFVNLSTARASTRTKEIGVKKTLGALRSTLVGQFLVESVMIGLIATLLAFPLIYGFRGILLKIAETEVPLIGTGIKEILLISILCPLILGLVAGIYPAFYLSGFKPIKALKGKMATGIKGSQLRNGLVIFQFAISIALMASVILIQKQTRYINQKSLGFEKDRVLVINHADKLGNQVESYRNEIAEFPEIAFASISMDMPGRGRWEDFYMREGSDIKLPISQIKIDEYFFPAMGLTLKTGRAFEKGMISDMHAVVINETAARLFDWEPEEALGEKIIYPGYDHDIRIIGVVKDFHFQSLHSEITPLMFFNQDSDMWGDQKVMAVKYNTSDIQTLLNRLEDNWQKLSDDTPFEYSFLDEDLTRLYDSDQQLGSLLAIFTGFSIFIAVMGMLGLVAYSVAKRQKEIGIRKVLGANRFQIWFMMNRLYFKLFLLSMIIATPLAWSALQDWLNTFAYRIELNVLIFFVAGFIVILISFLSIGYVSMRASSVNPAIVLKDE